MGRGMAVVTNGQGASGVGGRHSGTARSCIRSPEGDEDGQQGACALYATDDVELMAEIIVDMVKCDRI